VPLRDGRVADDFRIQALLPTLEYLIDQSARIVVCSHLGRPNGVDERFRMRPVAGAMSKLIGREVTPVPEVVGRQAEAAVHAIDPGHVVLLENLRFEPGETQNDAAFARKLAFLVELYVNDAFGACHRAHASVVGVPKLLPSAAGFLLQREVETLTRFLEHPPRPFVVVLGGAKVSDKLAVLEALAPHADVLAIGGAMAYTFMAARGEPTGASRTEPDRIEDARRVMRAAEASGRRLLLPSDHVVAQRLEAGAPSRVVREIPEGWLGVDIGPETASRYAEEIGSARTLFWNGPMGVFEIPAFSEGTRRVALAAADSGAVTVVGGGDSLAAVNQVGVGDRITHLSTGGGASLEYVQGLELPGVAALER
jgi:phosphoglycerate kinase